MAASSSSRADGADTTAPDAATSAGAPAEVYGAAGLTPAEAYGRKFPRRLRGYDRATVDAFQREVAAALWNATAQERASDAPAMVGNEVTQVLRAAQAAAAQVLAAAERDAASVRQRTLAEAKAVQEAADNYARKVQARAEQYWENRKAEADNLLAVAVARMAEAEREAARRSSLIDVNAREREVELAELERSAHDRLRDAQSSLDTMVASLDTATSAPRALEPPSPEPIDLTDPVAEAVTQAVRGAVASTLGVAPKR